MCVRSIARRWADLTWAIWSSGSRSLGKLLVNYPRKPSLLKYLQFCCYGRHLWSSRSPYMPYMRGGGSVDSTASSMASWWW